MNNRFKFRVWDKLAERIIYPHNDNQQHFIIDLNGCFHNLQNGSGGDDYVIQQYTGLNDKNGNLIFEGDIVEWGNLKYLVEWESNKWQSRCPYYHRYHHPKLEHFRDVESGIVVGNVNENSELLN